QREAAATTREWSGHDQPPNDGIRTGPGATPDRNRKRWPHHCLASPGRQAIIVAKILLTASRFDQEHHEAETDAPDESELQSANVSAAAELVRDGPAREL